MARSDSCQHAACDVTFGEDTQTVVGFENHSGVTDLGPGASTVRPEYSRAPGTTGTDQTVGRHSRSRFRHVLARASAAEESVVGPDLLLALALEHAVGNPVNLDPLDDAYRAKRNHSVALQKAMRNRGQRTAIEAGSTRSKRELTAFRPASRAGAAGIVDGIDLA